MAIYHRISEELIKCDNLHMDETRIHINKEEEKKASSQSWMWTIQSRTSENIKATILHYSQIRGESVPKALVYEFYGYLTTDAYVGYEKVDNIKRNLCWAHPRRYLV